MHARHFYAALLSHNLRSVRRADVCDLVRANILPHGSVFFDGYAFRKQEQQQQQQKLSIIIIIIITAAA